MASGLLGIGVVVAMTALDTATLGARQAVDQAYVNCVVRERAEAILAGPYLAAYGPGPDWQVSVNPVSDLGLQQLTVTAARGHAHASLTFWKSDALSGDAPAPGACR